MGVNAIVRVFPRVDICHPDCCYTYRLLAASVCGAGVGRMVFVQGNVAVLRAEKTFRNRPAQTKAILIWLLVAE